MAQKTREEHRAADAQQLEVRRSHGDALHIPREVEHFSYFRSNGKAKAAASELESAGFRVELTKSLFSTLVVARIDRDVLPETVEATVSAVYDIVTAAGGNYDGWGGSVAVEVAPTD